MVCGPFESGLVEPLNQTIMKTLETIYQENRIQHESKKLTFNDFVQMVRDDMMAGTAHDERPSEELVGKRAKAYYNEYLQGASVDDLF